MTFDFKTVVRDATHSLSNAFGEKPADIALVLGSGLGKFSERIRDAQQIPYSQIQGFPQPTVAGHAGTCIFGKVGARTVLAFSGRFHFYEGIPMESVGLPVRVAAMWGVKNVVFSAACGAIRKDLSPGRLMLLKDHINLTGLNPLRGVFEETWGPRFVDLTQAYDEPFRMQAKEIARSLKIPLPEGTYVGVSGPSYETPAEIKMLTTLGGDAVGMSTVPEVIVARQHGMRVMAIACLTNYAAGLKGAFGSTIDHEEVIHVSASVAKDFGFLLEQWISSVEL